MWFLTRQIAQAGQAVQEGRRRLAELAEEHRELQDAVRASEEGIDAMTATSRDLEERRQGLAGDIDELKRELPCLQEEYVDCLRRREHLRTLIRETQVHMHDVVEDFKKRVREDSERRPPASEARTVAERVKRSRRT
jgi:chromosome segregation ATPase